jgi:hypothetical protein
MTDEIPTVDPRVTRVARVLILVRVLLVARRWARMRQTIGGSEALICGGH